jgi:hypothetical protein
MRQKASTDQRNGEEKYEHSHGRSWPIQPSVEKEWKTDTADCSETVGITWPRTAGNIPAEKFRVI